jgi:ABC-type uncharacterized transport system substrate-binding protein
MHNHIIHGPNWPTGPIGFRAWTDKKPPEAFVPYPVGTGLVASLARPGGNATGLSNQSAELAGKRLELLREVLPGLRRLAIMANIGSPIGVLEMSDVQAAARTLGIEVAPFEIRRAEDICWASIQPIKSPSARSLMNRNSE